MVTERRSRLVAVLSHPAEVAFGLPWAGVFARQSGLPLTLLHIIDPVVNQELPANARLMAEDMLAMLLHHPATAGLDVDTRVEMGMPETVMSDAFAADPGILPILVAGQHGVFARRLLGRGNDHIIRAIRGPFVFLPPACGPAVPIAKAIVGNPPGFDSAGLVRATALVAGDGVEIVEASVHEPGSLADDAFRARTPAFDPVRVEMRGRASSVLLAAARTYDAGLITIGSHGSGQAYTRQLGSSAQRLATTADRPLLIVPGGE